YRPLLLILQPGEPYPLGVVDKVPLVLIQRGCLLSRIIHQIVGSALGEYVGVFFLDVFTQNIL
ncbi:MAG: hypothetical protein WHT29_12720, partial [Bacteroidales bacterium]